MPNSRQRRLIRRSTDKAADTRLSTSRDEDQQGSLSQEEPVSTWAKWRRRVWNTIGLPTTFIASISLLSTFFPHFTISEPMTMDPRYFFSKYVVLTNDGLVPVFGVRCGLAIGHITRINGARIDSYGEGADPQIEPPECDVGRSLLPGDAHTIAVNTVIQPDPPSDDVRDADFSVIVSYVPIPILRSLRMDRCVHFAMYLDSANNRHWFRTPLAPGRCPMFRWHRGAEPE